MVYRILCFVPKAYKDAVSQAHVEQVGRKTGLPVLIYRNNTRIDAKTENHFQASNSRNIFQGFPILTFKNVNNNKPLLIHLQIHPELSSWNPHYIHLMMEKLFNFHVTDQLAVSLLFSYKHNN